MYRRVRGEARSWIVPGQNIIRIWQDMATDKNKGADCTKAGQHPRLNSERDLWRGR